MVSFRSPSSQAGHLIRKKVAHRTSRLQLKATGAQLITSLATEHKYTGNLKRVIKWLEQTKKKKIDDLTSDIATQFLEEKSNEYTQKTLDSYRQAIQISLGLQLRRIPSKKTSILLPRAYRPEQIQLLCKFSDASLCLSIRIAECAGLRAHELDTIATPEDMAESQRPWLAERLLADVVSKNMWFMVKGDCAEQLSSTKF